MPQLEELYNSIIEAQARIQDDIVKTPLIFSQQFSDQFHCSLHLKLEHHQRTGSFKLRGAHSKLSLLSQDTDHQKTIVTASTGNHGLACLDAMSRYKMSGRIVVPDTVSQCKREKLTSLGADLVYHGTDCEETETAARAMASDSVEYVSPYNDLDIVSGTDCGYRNSPIFPQLKISCLQSINLLPKNLKQIMNRMVLYNFYFSTSSYFPLSNPISTIRCLRSGNTGTGAGGAVSRS